MATDDDDDDDNNSLGRWLAHYTCCSNQRPAKASNLMPQLEAHIRVCLSIYLSVSVSVCVCVAACVR